MPAHLELPFFPSTIDCLNWSKDNVIAVAGGESIGILTPRYKEPGANGTYWDSTTLRANAFTAEELPPADLKPFKDLSIAEEQSNRHVQALKWSSPGLGRYGRSVLAVLNSNHVLSIWENCGRLDSQGDWKRTVIVNHALKRHYDEAAKGQPRSKKKQNQVDVYANRVRAFTWSPPLHRSRNGIDDCLPFTDYGRQFMAVSNENEDILFLRFISPHDVLSPNTDWLVEVVHFFSARDVILNSIDIDTPDDRQATELASDIYIADHLAWSPVNSPTGFGAESTVAFITQGNLFCVAIKEDSNREHAGTALIHGACHNALSRSDLTGPLTFVPETQSVVAFGPDTIVCVDTARSFNDDKCSTMHHLDDRWDEVSGVAFSDSTSDTIAVHLTSILSSADSATSVLSLPLDIDEESTQPLWQRKLRDMKANFKRKHKLPGGVQERVWGMASSPMGDLVATATVLLPSEALIYMSPAEQRTQITITKQPLARHSILPIGAGIASPHCISHSLLLFSLVEYLEDHSSSIDSDDLLVAMLKCARVPDSDVGQAVLVSVSMTHYVHFLRWQLFFAAEMREARFRLLVDLAKRETKSSERMLQPVIRTLVEEVLKLPITFAEAGQLSGTVYAAYTSVQSKLLGKASSETGYEAKSSFNKEECYICKEGIAFESVKWARCAKGHQFARCGLTFMAMQEPGMTKICSICDTQFLDEWKLVQLKSSKDSNDTPNSEPEHSLARLLFSAFDHCVYCGGDFCTDGPRAR